MDRSRIVSWMVIDIAAAMILCSGCAFFGLRQDLEVIAQTAEIVGKVITPSETESPIFVALYNQQEETPVLQSYWIAYNSGEFRFLVPSGTYYLLAYEDKNEDAAFQSDERVGWYGDPSPLTLAAGSVSEGLLLKLQTPSAAQAEFSQLYAPLITTVAMEVPNRHIGTVASLSDSRFGSEYAGKGVWEPVKYLEEPGAGIFFLEPYDEAKIPILFVHGSGGFPQQWGPIIAGLDRSRFQPWILQYPSGLRLGLLGEFLEKYLAELQVKHRFNRLFIVAHSMGGLVSRCAVNLQVENRPSVFIRLLVTLSTPWQGHPTAAYGVDQSPLIIPSWYDMVPESPFLKKLRATKLPPSVEFDLFFGYRGEESTGGELSDGAVLLSSVLDRDIQEAAAKVYGFDEDHSSILESPAVIQRLNELLAKTAQR